MRIQVLRSRKVSVLLALVLIAAGAGFA